MEGCRRGDGARLFRVVLNGHGVEKYIHTTRPYIYLLPSPSRNRRRANENMLKERRKEAINKRKIKRARDRHPIPKPKEWGEARQNQWTGPQYDAKNTVRGKVARTGRRTAGQQEVSAGRPQSLA